MLTALLAFILGIVIFFERTKKISFSDTKTAVSAMTLSSLLIGSYVYIAAKIFIKINIYIFSESDEHISSEIIDKFTNVSIVANALLLFIFFVPCIAETIYVIASLVRKPANRDPADTDIAFSRKCAVKNCVLTVWAAAGFLLVMIVMAILIVPHMDHLKETILLINPTLLLIVGFFTLGIGIPVFCMFFVLENIKLLIIITVVGFSAGVMYIYSAVSCIAAASRAKKLGLITTGKLVGFILFGLIPIWNAAAAMMLKKIIENGRIVVKANVVNGANR